MSTKTKYVSYQVIIEGANMPFIDKEKRAKVNTLTEDEVRDILFTYKATKAGFNVGDRCYYFYKKMIKKWKANRSWTTAHEIYCSVVGTFNQNMMDNDTKRAHELAWQVFFQLHVIPYELEKRKLNGDITSEIQQEGNSNEKIF